MRGEVGQQGQQHLQHRGTTRTRD